MQSHDISIQFLYSAYVKICEKLILHLLTPLSIWLPRYPRYVSAIWTFHLEKYQLFGIISFPTIIFYAK